jgi:hypothetical protein
MKIYCFGETMNSRDAAKFGRNGNCMRGRRRGRGEERSFVALLYVGALIIFT